MALRQLEQRVAHDDARDLPRPEDPRCTTGEEIDVRDREEIELLLSDVAQELVVFPRVPADLLDDEARAGLCLLPELEVLRHDLPFVALVVRDHASEEEVGAVEAPPWLALVLEARVHVREEAQKPDGVDVEDRRGEAPVTHDRVVAGKREHVVEPGRGELPAAALERVPVPVLAGEVDDHLLPARDHVRPERVGREHRVAARVVRYREHVDPGVLGQLPRKCKQLLARRRRSASRDSSPPRQRRRTRRAERGAHGAGPSDARRTRQPSRRGSPRPPPQLLGRRSP